MAKAKYVNGKDLMIFIDGKAIALATSCSLSLSADTMDAGNKDDGCWQANDAGDLSWEASTDALLSFDEDRTTDAVYEDLFDAFVARKLVTVTFGIPGNAVGDYLSVKVRTAGLLKRALKEVHALGGDYVSVLLSRGGESPAVLAAKKAVL